MYPQEQSIEHFDATVPVSDTAHNAGLLVFVTVTPPWIMIYPVGSASFLSYWPDLFSGYSAKTMLQNDAKSLLVCVFNVVRIIYPF